jgi:hypothetical protein
MAGNDESTEVWSDGTPVAPPAGAPQPAFSPPPVRRRGPPIWLIGGGVVVVVLLAIVLAVVFARNIGAATTATTAPTAAVSSAAPVPVAASTAAPTSAPTSVPQTAAQAAPSATETVQQAAAQFGLIGVWAADCTQPVSDNDSYETFTASADGTISDNINMVPDWEPSQYRWDTGQMIGSDQIALVGVYLGDGTAMHATLQKGADGRMRVLQATNGAGVQQVVNGAFPGGGAPGWQTKCS